MLSYSVRGGNVTICIQFFLVNSTTNGNFFRTWFLIYMPVVPLSSNLHQEMTCLISSTCQYIQPPLFLSPSPPVSLRSSSRGCDLAGTPCINNCMNISVLLLHSVPCYLELVEMLCCLLCLSGELATLMIECCQIYSVLWGVHVASNIISRESRSDAVFPCLAVFNLSGIHSNNTEFGESN